jgi:hypothetical protein
MIATAASAIVNSASVIATILFRRASRGNGGASEDS